MQHRSSGLKVVLSGLSGAGKSTVGRLLADRLQCALVDLDANVERSAGCAIPTIFETRGEPVFRQLESDALRAALELPECAVIAAGGGALVSADNRALLNRGSSGPTVVVWLRVSPQTAAARVQRSEVRPLVAHDPVDGLRRLLQKREALYGLADLQVDAEAPAASVADAIMTGLSEGGWLS